MSELTASIPLRTSWRDYLEICKPKVVLLLMVTAIIGMFLATPGMVPLSALIFGSLGIAMAAGSAAAINHILDRQIDAGMARTRNRPLVKDRLSQSQAVVFAVILGVAGIGCLALLVNLVTAWLTLGSLIGYAFVYTVYLKRATPQNIVIGGLSGACPPLLGWTAVTGKIEADALLLVLIIFAWTPPHFWALAIARRDEYAKVQIPMLPVTHGSRYAALHILLYTLMMVAVSLLPFVSGMSGLFYLCGALVLGSVFLSHAVMLLRDTSRKRAMATFKYSIWYLLWLFLAMLGDHYI